MASGRQILALNTGDRIVDRNGLYALTTEYTFEIEHRLTLEKIKADHLRVRYPDPLSKMAREVGILKVQDDDKHKIEAALPRVNLHYYGANGHSREFDMEREATRVFQINSLIQQRSGIRVYKEGPTTGKTFDIFTNIHSSMEDA
ncbi:hypothetical protein J4E85_011103 [Alternaria conjuncta]|uniref:uncharacterized protein n=1 Tax=Alternaria conjuncta TaxID=181017 RepID=UPI00221EF585|nr:uncharacterized protein J4E85_011103 [Alternaria conjuncta]KAI4912169.1 hypothetical protein J4E85_011103 [Alternaria conjuncta]